jgi:hypothetical protein
MAVGLGVDPMLAAIQPEAGDAGPPASGRVVVAGRAPAGTGISLIERSRGASARTAVAVMDRPDPVASANAATSGGNEGGTGTAEDAEDVAVRGVEFPKMFGLNLTVAV